MNAVCQLLQKYGPLLARVLFVQLFIVSGPGPLSLGRDSCVDASSAVSGKKKKLGTR